MVSGGLKDHFLIRSANAGTLYDLNEIPPDHGGAVVESPHLDTRWQRVIDDRYLFLDH